MTANLVTDGRVIAPSGIAYAVGSSKTCNPAAHANKIGLLDTATGSVVTLPQATGTGNRYRFIVSALATANSHIVQVGNGTDVMIGLAFGYRTDSGNATLGFGTSATSDTITLNRSTTGSVQLGESIDIVDVATGVFYAEVRGVGTGAAYATPFSAAVS